MRYKLLILLFCSVSALVTATQSFAADSSCAGCDELKSLQAKFSALKEGDDDHALPLLRKASSAVRRMGKKLTKQQVHAISLVLLAAYPNDPVYSIVDNNYKIFEANQKAFAADFKTFPTRDADNLASELDIALKGEGHGPASDDDNA